MNFAAWEPAYEAILADFGYDRAADEHARDVLAGLVEPFPLDRLEAELDGASVAVAGGADSLRDELSLASDADVVLAASTAADVLVDAGIEPAAVVTDLDKTPDTAADLSARGVVVVAHAHGDNVPAVREWVPRFAPDAVLATTQAAPSGQVRNFGGFTDGDRAAFLADHLGAASMAFPGWDFDDPSVGAEKARKLAWAERLLRWLERRRGESFDLLDGRRESIGLPWLDA